MAEARVSIPAAVRRTIHNIKEIAGSHTEEEVYAALRECDMDPDETTRKLLLHQDGTGRNALAGKKNDLNPSLDKCSSSSTVNPSTTTKKSASTLSLSGGLSNSPSQTPAPKAKNSFSISHAHRECEIIANKHVSRSQRAAGLVSDDVSAVPTDITQPSVSSSVVLPSGSRPLSSYSSSQQPGGSQKDQLCQMVAATVTHSRSDVAPSADLADGILPLLPDDLLVEILSRLPVKPVHRFKCVSKSWHDLISNHRKRFPQALAGLFYWSWRRLEKGRKAKLQFINFLAKGPPPVDPSLAFLPNHASFIVEDCCNGLLLLFSSFSKPRNYVVCNPETKKWVALPNSGVTGEMWHSLLAFDPAVSVHFHVLEYVEEDPNGLVGIYSSRTGCWSHSVLRCSSLYEYSCIPGGPVQWTAFLNGMLHFLCDSEVMSIDLETKEWSRIQLPVAKGETKGVWYNFFGQSDSYLVYVCSDQDTQSFWILEDYDSGAWSLKHRVSLTKNGSWGEAHGAFHPHCNILFYLGKGRSVMSYDFDRGELCHIAADGFCTARDEILPYVPYFGDFGV